MLIRPVSFQIVCCVLMAVCAAGMFSPFVTADETAAIWGVNAGDSFQVSVVIVKQTEVTIDDQPPIVSATTDKMRLDYRVVQVSATGEAVFVARLHRPNRETETSSSDSLKSAAGSIANLEDLLVVIHLDADGIVQKVSPADKESILAHAVSLDPSALPLLQRACPEEVIAGWFGRPFWIACDPEAAKEGHTWNRSDDIAVGGFGTLRNSNDLRIGARNGQFTDVKISGSGRFVPLVLPQTDSQFKSMMLKEVTAELDRSSGTARVFLKTAHDEKTKPVRKRPQFESMELTIAIHGRGLLQTEKSTEPRQVSFRQTQIQSWNLVDFEFGRPEFLFNVPVPVDAK